MVFQYKVTSGTYIRSMTILLLLLMNRMLEAQEIRVTSDNGQGSQDYVHGSRLLHKPDSLTDHFNPLDSLNNNTQWMQKLQQKSDSLTQLPEYYLTQIDSLLQTKLQLLQEKIKNLQTDATKRIVRLDSISNISSTNHLGQNTGELNNINESLQAYKSKITDPEELAWIEHYSGQLDQWKGW